MDTSNARQSRVNADKIEALFGDLGKVLLKHDAAIFFNIYPGNLWIGGEEIGTIDHHPEGCGHTFILETQPQEMPLLTEMSINKKDEC